MQTKAKDEPEALLLCPALLLPRNPTRLTWSSPRPARALKALPTGAPPPPLLILLTPLLHLLLTPLTLPPASAPRFAPRALHPPKAEGKRTPPQAQEGMARDMRNATPALKKGRAHRLSHNCIKRTVP